MTIEGCDDPPRWGGVAQGDNNENPNKSAISKVAGIADLARSCALTRNDAGTWDFRDTHLTHRLAEELRDCSPELRRKCAVVEAALRVWPLKTKQGQALERPKLLRDIDDLAAMIRAQSVG
jgi:hypothetical protein